MNGQSKHTAYVAGDNATFVQTGVPASSNNPQQCNIPFGRPEREIYFKQLLDELSEKTVKLTYCEHELNYYKQNTRRQ